MEHEIYTIDSNDGFPSEWNSNPQRGNNDLIQNSHSIEIDGLDMTTATEWIYPTNYPVRDYQKSIVTQALFQNTLVSLPTGLGKTFIAAVVMYNFNRWYPHHKIVFMAHSKPLVAQQIEACCQIMGIPQTVTAELNGNVNINVRRQQWDSKQIFFLTPQVFNNDLTRGLVRAESIRCVVIDEAHKALGNQAFCQVIRALQPFNTTFRVLALSATPGDDIPMVKSVIENLLISHLELRTDEDPDIQKYLHNKKVEAVVVSLDAKIIEYKNQLLLIAEKYLKSLVQIKAITGSFGSLSSFSLVLKQKQFNMNPSVETGQRGFALSNFSIAISLYKALEELVIHGLRSFLNKILVLKSGEGAKNNSHHRLAKDPDFIALVDAVENYIGQDKDVAFDPDVSMARLQDELDAQVQGEPMPIVYSHPKFVILEEIITQHFDEWKNKNESTRVIVFCKSRPCTGEICNFLNRFRPLVKPMVLIGQSNGGAGSTTRGLKQSAQLEVMRKFRSGLYNTLVATCVGEEGLDVGEVDLIVNFDASRNSNTQVQRCGRTGRKRDGRIVNLVTEGKEYQDYNISVTKSKNITAKLSKGIKNLPLYPNSIRMLPDDINPTCHEMFLRNASDKKQIPDEKSKPVKIAKSTKKTKKSAAKKNRKSPNDDSYVSQKYDIRYAMSKAVEKAQPSSSYDDTSDSLFECVGAVALFKDKAAHSKKSPEILVRTNVEKRNVPEIICLEGSLDEFPVVNNNNDNPSLGSESRHNPLEKDDDFLINILRKPLDGRACDILDTLSIDELVTLFSKNQDDIKKNFPKDYSVLWNPLNKSLVSESDDSMLDENFHDIPLPTPPDSLADLVYSSNEWDEIAIDNPILEENKQEPISALNSVLLRDLNSSTAEQKPFDDTMFEKSCRISEFPKECAFNLLNETPVVVTPTPALNKLLPMSKNSDVSMVTVTQAISMVASYKVGQKSSAVTSSAARGKGNQENDLPVCVTEHQSSPTLLKINDDKSGVDTITTDKKTGDFSVTSGMKLLSNPFFSPKSFNPMKYSLPQNNKERSPLMSLHQNSSITNMSIPATPSPTHCISENEFSPSLVSSGISSNHRRSKVKKSLIFQDPPHLETPTKPNFTLFNLESDEDLFADDEKEWNAICTQNQIETKENKPANSSPTQVYDFADFNTSIVSSRNVSTHAERPSRPVEWPPPRQPETTPKTAIVRPLGFENLSFSLNDDSGWLSTSNKPKATSLIPQPGKKAKILDKSQMSLNSFLKFGRKSNNATELCSPIPNVGHNNSNCDTVNPRVSPNNSFSNFDCMPDDLANMINSSPIHINLKSTPLHHFKSKIKQSTPLPRQGATKTDISQSLLLDDDDLSQGALDALKAVENFEKGILSSKASPNVSAHSELPVFDLWSSDDSDEFFEKKPSAEKRQRISKKLKDNGRKAKKVHRRKKKAQQFIEEEAELSGSSRSSDEENTSGLDEMDSSFLDERLAPTQAPDVDMTARYLATVKSPRVIAGAFKIPHTVKNNFNVFSQAVQQDEDYEQDSFCVDDTGPVEEELSALELAELILEKKKKRRRRDSPAVNVASGRKKKRRRIVVVDSSSGDDELQVELPRTELPPKSNNVDFPLKECKNQLDLVFQDKRRDMGNKSSAPHVFQPYIIIGSRQVASAPEVTVALRSKFKCRVEVRSCPGADFIVSWRLGIIRIVLSDFLNGSPIVKASVKESVTKLLELFLKPFIIVEDDKNKNAPRTVGCHKDMWAKHSAKRLARLHHAGITTHFTRDKEETASVIAALAKMECEKDYGIVTDWPEIPPQLETRLKFYTSLPGVNIAMALRLCRKFSTLASFLSTCDSVRTIVREIGVYQTTASRIYHALLSAST